MSLNQAKGSLFGSGGGGNTSNTVKKKPTVSAAVSNRPKAATGPVLTGPARIAKLAEAEKHIESGNKFLKTSMFSWKPNTAAAAPCFSQAATCYKLVGDLARARELFIQSADNNEEAGASAARALELSRAAEVSETMGEAQKAAELYQMSGMSWAEHGELVKYSDMLYKAAKALDGAASSGNMTSGKGADEFYEEALQVLCPPGTPADKLAKLPSHTMELLRDHFRCLVRKGDFAQALVTGERAADIFQALNSEASLHKMLCALTIVQLTLGDVVAAEQQYAQHLGRLGYMRASESEVAEAFMMAFRELDAEALEAAQRNSKLNYLERDVVTIARSLTLKAKAKPAPAPARAPVPAAAAAATVAAAAPPVKAIAAVSLETPPPLPAPALGSVSATDGGAAAAAAAPAAAAAAPAAAAAAAAAPAAAPSEVIQQASPVNVKKEEEEEEDDDDEIDLT